MKAIKSTSVTTMMDRFDNELKNIIMNDLKALRAAKNKIVNSIQQRGHLYVA